MEVGTTNAEEVRVVLIVECTQLGSWCLAEVASV